MNRNAQYLREKQLRGTEEPRQTVCEPEVNFSVLVGGSADAAALLKDGGFRGIQTKTAKGKLYAAIA